MSGSPASVAVDGCWVRAQTAGPAGAAKSRTVAAKKSALIILLSRYSLKNTACCGFMTINVIWNQGPTKGFYAAIKRNVLSLCEVIGQFSQKHHDGKEK
jgi:hypothetical protein